MMTRNNNNNTVMVMTALLFTFLVIVVTTLPIAVVDAFVPIPQNNRQTSCSLHDAAIFQDAIDNFYQNQPYVAGFLTCSFKAGTADFLAQQKKKQQQTEDNGRNRGTTTSPSISSQMKRRPSLHQRQDEEQEEESKTVDVSRSLAFIVYGGLYQGVCGQFLFRQVYPTLFGCLPEWQNVLCQVGMDQLFVGPLLCLPIAYIVKSLFTSDRNVLADWDTAIDVIQNEGLQQYWEDVTVRNLLIKYWSLWIPVNCLTFSVVPLHYRVAFVAAVSFFWVFILSSVSAAGQQKPQRFSSSPRPNQQPAM